jgi:membrane fusion protein (multidrug efflux system)
MPAYRPNRHVLAAAASTALFLSLVACSGGADPAASAGAGGPPGGMALPVEAVTVKAEPLQAGITTVGTLRADESVVIRPEINGRLVAVHFEEGQRVRQGDKLFSMDASVTEADLREAQANFENARRANARAEDLGSRQLLSRSDVDTAKAQLGVAQARVASARAQLDKTTIVAPFNGVIGLREASVGAVLSPGQALVNLVRLDPMEVDFSLPEGDLAAVAPGQPVRLTVDAYPGEAFTGEVMAIEPVIDVNSRSAKVRARVPNPDYRLRPGLFARVTLEVGEAGASAILVPEQALLQEGETRFVYVVRDGKAARAVVRTGQRLPGRVAIVEGLSEGDQVITAGQAKPMMFEGAEVLVMPAQDGPRDAAAAPANDASAG